MNQTAYKNQFAPQSKNLASIIQGYKSFEPSDNQDEKIGNLSSVLVVL
jgi:hypothetical protein